MEDILIDTEVLDRVDKADAETGRPSFFYSEFELYLGAKTERHQRDLEMIFNEVRVVAFDFGCGRIAAKIWKGRELTHQHLEIKDIFIASIAIYNDVWLRTFNEKHFRGIDNLKMWQWQ